MFSVRPFPLPSLHILRFSRLGLLTSESGTSQGTRWRTRLLKQLNAMQKLRDENRASPPNVWVQPLDGSPRHQFTHLTDETPIVDFAWSNDGARLAIARANVARDIVLFTGLLR